MLPVMRPVVLLLARGLTSALLRSRARRFVRASPLGLPSPSGPTARLSIELHKHALSPASICQLLAQLLAHRMHRNPAYGTQIAASLK